MTRIPTTIRFTDEERKEIEATMKRYGHTQLAPFIRFAIRQIQNEKQTA